MSSPKSGPLSGLKIVEIGGIGPGPFTAMMLSDMGADIIRVDRPGKPAIDRDPKKQVNNRGRLSVAVDLKKPGGAEAVLRLIDQADGLIEGFRPGVMEKLGLGPDVCIERNPKLVYGRMTGWGQDGPMAKAAGHDINYISISGALAAIGEKGGGPVPPLNLVGDFGGGGMLLAFGLVCGLLNAKTTGKGQVVDAAMSEGAATLMSSMYGMYGTGFWKDDRGSNWLDGGCFYYGAYECSCGNYISIGSIEPQFYALLLEKTGIDDPAFKDQHDRDAWEPRKKIMAEVFRSKSRDEWCEIMEGSDVCFAPVLTMGEAPNHPHNKARGAFVEIDGIVQPAPSPRFSATPAGTPGSPPAPGEHSTQALGDWGFDSNEIETLISDGVVIQK